MSETNFLDIDKNEERCKIGHSEGQIPKKVQKSGDDPKILQSTTTIVAIVAVLGGIHKLH